MYNHLCYLPIDTALSSVRSFALLTAPCSCVVRVRISGHEYVATISRAKWSALEGASLDALLSMLVLGSSGSRISGTLKDISAWK